MIHNGQVVFRAGDAWGVCPELAPPRVAGPYGLGSMSAQHGPTIELAKALGCNMVLPNYPETVSHIPKGWWWGLLPRTATMVAMPSTVSAMLKDRVMYDPLFRWLGCDVELAPAGDAFAVEREYQTLCPWMHIVHGPLDDKGANATFCNIADTVIDYTNVSGQGRMGLDVVAIMATLKCLCPGKEYMISPQLTSGSGNVLGDATEIAIAIEALTEMADMNILALWGTHHAASRVPSAEWTERVRAAIEYFYSYTPSMIATLPYRPPMSLKWRGIFAVSNLWWDWARCRLIWRAGFMPQFDLTTDPRLEALLPLGSDAAPGQIYYRLLGKWREGGSTREDVVAMEETLAAKLQCSK